ncbi:ATP-binding cassette domain-containing protein [bacterium]|nr:ATP-binding cassette domain-containing protein [bacterium]
MSNPILKIKNLNVEYPLFGGILQREVSCVHAVKNLSIDIHEGKTVGIVGESGSGKSTLGKAILNVLNLTAPDVRITGEVLLNENGNYIDIMSLSKKELVEYRPKMQMIFQDPFSSLNPRMIVKDIIREPLDIHTSLSQNEKDEKVRWLLNKVGLSVEQEMRYPHEFSGGQRQRIGIARALATEPKIIIADEPVSALDVSIQAQVINLMMDLQEEFNLTILFIAHDLSVVKHISSNIGVMYLGNLVESGDSDIIFSNPQHNYTKKLLSAIPQPNPEGREERKIERLKNNQKEAEK